MDLLIYFIERGIHFSVASTPLIITYFSLKVRKLSVKGTVANLLYFLIISIFYWLKLKSFTLALYFCIPFFLSFLWVFAEYVLIKKGKTQKAD